jgi:putative membrane protein
VVWSALAVAIAVQISYPLLNGNALRIITFATVLSSSLAMALHALLTYGRKYAINYLLITLTFAFTIEQIGLHTGWPFGYYKYDQSLGWAIAGVPLIVPFAWTMLAHPILIAARRINPRWSAVIGGFGLMAWDLFLDPQMVAANRWRWTFDGAHVPFQPEIPLSNTFGWLLTGMALIALLHQILPRDRRKSSASFGAVDFFLSWTFFAGIVSNLFFFHRPGIALLGGVAFGLFFLPYAFSRWLGRP